MRRCCLSQGSAASAALLSVYTLDSNFSDSLGANPDLVPFNNSSGAWVWNATRHPGGGLIMDVSASLASVNTIGLRMELHHFYEGPNDHHVKLIDYKNQTDDGGLYFLDNALLFYPAGFAGGTATANTFFDLLVTRNASNQMSVYLNGSSTPVNGSARFRLFNDDTLLIDDDEWSTGSVQEIRIWNHVLTSGEVASAFNPVPEPSLKITSFYALGSGVFELELNGKSSTACEFRASTTLEFNPGILVENLVEGDPGDPGTIGGPNGSVVTTDGSDGSGNARVRMSFAGPADFVRAQSSE